MCFLCRRSLLSFSYDLHLTPDLQAFTFSGVCDVTFQAKPNATNETKSITLHAKELSFVSAKCTIFDKDDQVVETIVAEEIRTSVKTTCVSFVFGQDIPTVTNPKIVLSIVYSGFLNNQMAGFYRSGYTDIAGQAKIMASTQFESLDARRCFPCVDEPAAKAVFSVSLTIDAKLQALSNMPVASQQSLSIAQNKITFLDTPIMSTYLLAICVGEFDYVQTLTSHGVLVSVYTPPGKSHMGGFALDTAARALDAYDDFFHVPYPLPKLDMIAIPEFAMGAMEVSTVHFYGSGSANI